MQPKAISALEATLSEELLDELDKAAVPAELVDHWLKLEEEAFASSKSKEGLPPRVREASLRFLDMFLRSVGLPQESWHDAALLLDLCSLSSAGDIDLELLPATCAAIVLILRKNAGSMIGSGVSWSSSSSDCRRTSLHAAEAVPMARPDELSSFASQLLKWLVKEGIVSASIGPVTVKQVLQQELSVLRLLHWRVQQPSVHAWTRLFCKRLDVLTGRIHRQSLEWIERVSMTISQELILHTPPSTVGLFPYDVAVGVFGHLLIMAQLLPLGLLRPQELSSAQWELLFAETQSQGPLPSCPLSDFDIALVKNSLELSSGQAVSEVANRTMATAQAMRRRTMAAQSTIGGA